MPVKEVMVNSVEEIKELEDRLRQAELGPDPEFFAQVLADDAVLDGQRAKSKVIEAHRPGKGPKFAQVEMSDFQFADHGTAVVVTCSGTYAGPQWSGTLKFMRVWFKKDGRWQIIAGSITK
jgi:hypothetical protein